MQKGGQPAGCGDTQRILIVDDSLPVLDALRELLTEDGGFEVVATATRAAEALLAARDVHPEVAVIDVNMPDGCGWALARALGQAVPGIRMVAYSAYEDSLVVRAMAAAGAAAYVSKDEPIERLVDAIRGLDVMPEPPAPAALMGRVARTRSSRALPTSASAQTLTLARTPDNPS